MTKGLGITQTDLRRAALYGPPVAYEPWSVFATMDRISKENRRRRRESGPLLLGGAKR